MKTGTVTIIASVAAIAGLALGFVDGCIWVLHQLDPFLYPKDLYR